MIAWTLFTNPIEIQGSMSLWLLVPLCVAVSLVYKTVRAHTVRDIWLESIVLVGYIIAGLAALGAGLWLMQQYWP